MRGDGGIVEADDREILRYIQTPLTGSMEHARRHFVIGRENGGWRRDEVEKKIPCPKAGFEGIAPFGNQTSRQLDLAAAERVLEAEPSLGSGTEPVRPLDETDAPMALLDQVIDRLANRLPVI